MIDLVLTHLTHPWGPPWTLETLGDHWRPLATRGDMLDNYHFGGNISDMKRWHVTRDRLISLEIGAQQQADQCQNFGFGHNFCH